MGDRPYSDLVALLVAAVILLIMISITEAATSHNDLVGEEAEVRRPATEV